MSGTASRNQTRLTYAPGLRIGAYPGQMPSGSQTPIPGVPMPAVPGVVPVSSAPQASGGVMFGSIRDRERDPALPGSGSEGGMSDASAMSGAPSTGSFLSDLAGFGRAAGPMGASVAFGGPMGVLGGALGLMGLGVANAINPAFARDVATAIGLDIGGAGATVGDPVGIGSPGTPDLGGPVASDPSQSVKDDAFGGDMGGGGGPVGTDGDKPGSDSAASPDGNDGGGKGGGGGGEDGGSKGGDWMRGGYTGAGNDGMVEPQKIAGRVHEGEVVIPASQVARYGLDPLMMLARGQVEPSRLMALLRS